MANQELTGLVVKIKADLNDYVLELAKMEQVSDKTAKGVGDKFSRLGTVFTTVGAGVATFAAMAIKSASSWGNAVDDLSDKTGMTGEEASKLLVLAKATGIGVEDANAIFAKFGKTIYTSADAYAKAAAAGKQSDDVLTRLGVSALNVDGSMRSTSDIFKDVKNSLSSMEDGWQKTAIEMELFGRSGYQLHDMLNMTDADMQKAIDKAKAMGLIISSETAAGWEKFERQLNSTKGSLTGVSILIGNEMLPTLDKSLGKVQDIIKAFVVWRNANPQLADSLGGVATGILGVAAAVKVLELAALRVPAWAVAGGAFAVGAAVTIGGVAVGIGTQLSGTTGASGAADNEVIGWTGNDRPTDIATFDRRAEEQKVNAIAPSLPGKQPPTELPGFLGGGGGSGGKEETALEKWIKLNNELFQIEQERLKLGDISQERLDEFVSVQMTALVEVPAGEDEANRKLIEQLKLRGLLLTSIEKQKQAHASAMDYFEKQAEEEAADIKNAMEERAQQYVDDYQFQLTLDEKRIANKQVLMDRLLEEERSYFAKRNSLSGEEALQEAAQETVRADKIKKLRQEMLLEEVDSAQRSKEAWADALTGIATNTRTEADVIKQIWSEMVSNMIRNMMGLQQAGGGLTGGGGLLSGLFSGLFDGGSTAGIVNTPSIATAWAKTPSFTSGMVFSGAKGFDVPDVPGDIPMYVHRKEMVLPADLADIIRNGGNGSGGVTISPVFNIETPDPDKAGKQILSIMPTIKREIATAMVDEPYMRNAVNRAVKKNG